APAPPRIDARGSTGTQIASRNRGRKTPAIEAARRFLPMRKQEGFGRRATIALALIAIGSLLLPTGLDAAPRPGEPRRFADQLNLRQVGADRAWSLTRGSPEIVVGVVDTGIDDAHPELRGRTVPGRNFADNNDRTVDPDGHGTFVAGVIAAQGAEMWGVAPG